MISRYSSRLKGGSGTPTAWVGRAVSVPAALLVSSVRKGVLAQCCAVLQSLPRSSNEQEAHDQQEPLEAPGPVWRLQIYIRKEYNVASRFVLTCVLHARTAQRNGPNARDTITNSRLKISG